MLLKFTIILKNNSNNQFKILNNVEGDVYEGSILFKNIDLDVISGEYTALIFLNYREDVEYELNNEVLNSKVIVEGNIFSIKLLRPIIQMIDVQGKEVKNVSYTPPYKEELYKNNDLKIMFYK